MFCSKNCYVPIVNITKHTSFAIKYSDYFDITSMLRRYYIL